MALDSSSGGFGAKLRETRERRGVSLRQIANATKISVAALEALERNDISRLPGGIFSRAFVRSYAIEVGLDPDKAIQEFITQFPSDAPASELVVVDTVEADVPVVSDRRMGGAWLWFVLVSLPIVGATLYFAMVRRTHAKPDVAPVTATSPAPDSNRAAETSPTPASPEPSPSVADAPAPVAAMAPAVAPAGAPPTPEATASSETASETNGEGVTVSLSVKRPCWVAASVDGAKRIERLMQPGEQQILEVKRELVLTAGDASAIALTFNGAAARPLGKAGEVVTARFNVSNYKDYVLQSR
jgi:cytoskeletal protein RodZ